MVVIVHSSVFSCRECSIQCTLLIFKTCCVILVLWMMYRDEVVEKR